MFCGGIFVRNYFQSQRLQTPDPNHWRILEALGIHSEKLLKRVYEQDLNAVKSWLSVNYRAIEKLAHQEGADIVWGDESGLHSDAQVGRNYALIGKTPEIQPNPQRAGLNYITGISH